MNKQQLNEIKQFNFATSGDYFMKIWKNYQDHIVTPFEYLENKGVDYEAEYYSNDDLDSMPDFVDFEELVETINGKAPTQIYELIISSVQTGTIGQDTVDLRELVYDLHDGFYALVEDYTGGYAIMKKEDYEKLLVDLQKAKQNRISGGITGLTGFSQNEVKRLQKIAGILKESDGSGEVQATIQRYAPTLLKALKMRSRDREDINAHDAVKKILETIASSLGLDSSIPFMEDEMFSGVYSPQEALKYTEEMFRDMKEGENGIKEDDYSEDTKYGGASPLQIVKFKENTAQLSSFLNWLDSYYTKASSGNIDTWDTDESFYFDPRTLTLILYNEEFDMEENEEFHDYLQDLRGNIQSIKKQ